MKILFTGGGTGGHIFPLVAIIRQLKKISKEPLELFYLGPKDNFSKEILSQEGVKVFYIFCGKWRRYITLESIFQNIIDLLKIPIGFFQSLFFLLIWYPDLIFSKGGFGSLPVVFAGWILRIPIFLHESDIIPGLTNRILSKFALEIFTSFPNTEFLPKEKIILTGNPIRKEILEGIKEEGILYFKISKEKPILLILGGSQGAQRINDRILEIINELLEKFEIIHQIGKENFKETMSEVEIVLKKDLEKYYHPFPFLNENELKLAYAVADLIVARAGSGTIFEIAALGKPSILIPLPEAAQNHQLFNAYEFSKEGAAIILEQENFTPKFFLEKLKSLFSNPQNLERMAKKAKEFSKPSAAEIIATYIYDFLTK